MYRMEGSRILVVEDEELVRSIIRKTLSRHHVVDVCRADEGARLLQEQEFDLLLTDRKLPGAMDGDELVRLAHASYPEMPVVVLTAYCDAESARSCFTHGVFDYLTKPFDVSELAGVVERALSGQEPSGRMDLWVPLEGWVELTAPSHKGFLRRFQRFCDLLFKTRFDEKTQRDLRLAVEELGQNAVDWGNEGDLERKIRITFCMFPEEVMLRIEDEGSGFEPSGGESLQNLLALQQQRKAEGKRPGGLGLRLVEKIMDSVIWSEQGNKVLCVKRLPRVSTPSL